MRPVRAAVIGVVIAPSHWHDIVEQFDVIGVGSLTVVLLTGFFTGAALALQSGLTLISSAGRSLGGRLISASMIKELAGADRLMLTGRVGSGIAAELGSMVVTDQIYARAPSGRILFGSSSCRVSWPDS